MMGGMWGMSEFDAGSSSSSDSDSDSADEKKPDVKRHQKEL
jgi:hypothetical protein